MGKINAKTILDKEKDRIKIENKIMGLAEYGTSAESEKGYIALKYFDKNFECFSEWTPDELVCFSSFIDKINRLEWKEIKKHPGLRFKSIDNAKGIPNNDIKERLSKDITFCEFRVSQKARVVGFRNNAVFFLCWLDRNHRICAE